MCYLCQGVSSSEFLDTKKNMHTKTKEKQIYWLSLFTATATLKIINHKAQPTYCGHTNTPSSFSLIILQKDFKNIISKYVKLIFRIFILPAFGNAHCFSLVIYPPTNCKIPVSDKHHARIIPVKRIRASLTSPEIAQLLRERVCALNVHQ